MIPYECADCGTVVSRQENATNGSARIRNACKTCGAVTTHEKAQKADNDLPEERRQELRRKHPEVYISTQNNRTKRMHFIDGDETACEINVDKRKVNVEKYPIGYLEWCEKCIETAHRKTNNEKREEIKANIRDLANNRDEQISMNAYRRIGYKPSTYLIRELFGSWDEAKHEAMRKLDLRPTQRVWYTAGRRGRGNETEIFHTDRSCPALYRAEHLKGPTKRENLPEDWGLCTRCEETNHVQAVNGDSKKAEQ